MLAAPRRVPFAAVDPTNRNTALASTLVEELARCGVRHAALAPGSRSTPLALALWRQPAIDVAVIVDERSAGFFALGAAYATGQPTVVLCTSGTAAANLHPAVCEADESGVPLIVLTADRPPELRGIGAGQTIDQLKLYGSAVRWFCEVGTHDADDAGLLHYRSVACRAYAAARGDPRPGPVHLNLAWRDPLGPEPHPEDVTATSELALHGRAERPLTAVPQAGAAPPSDALIEVMVDHVAEWRRGLIVCGRQPDPALAAPVAELARAGGYPIIAEPTSQLRLGPHDRSRVVSTYDLIARARPETLAPEFVLRFGELPTSKALRAWIGSLHDCRQLVVDGECGWNEPTNTAATVMRVDPVAFAARLSSAVAAGGDDSFSASWTAADAAAADAIANELGRVNGASEPGVHAALGQMYEDGDLVYTASSMPIRDQEAFVRPGPASVRFLANRGANGIDGLISSGIGAAAASGRPTWIVTGDLGLYHDMNGLAAIREASAPVRIVVLNNDGGGIFEFLPQADQVDRDEFEGILGTPLGLEPARIAELYGLPHVRVTDLAELESAAETGAGIIEIPVDRSQNVEVHRRIAERAAEALSAISR
ncbi:MAG: 2-succinyl-5-enolpyruvyl-6-hydroxy-3-cyclohexene-1-carboxylic-acid synthase [Actinobacteria bacterium]|nr:MAG: 2-succinyl-5-enolpyruvyl-6-hydroxy-3-cyclohexene-1-carboxylic-acid synthase [Actinomycetota bacterium]